MLCIINYLIVVLVRKIRFIAQYKRELAYFYWVHYKPQNDVLEIKRFNWTNKMIRVYYYCIIATKRYPTDERTWTTQDEAEH